MGQTTCETKEQSTERSIPFPHPWFVAELSSNHCGSYPTAVDMVKAAANCGCAFAKVQLFTPDQMVPNSHDERFKLPNDSPWAGTYLWDLYEKIKTPLEWFPELMAVGKESHIQVMASVYHPDMVAFAEKYGNPIYKIASFEVGYVDLLKEVAKTGKPAFVSLGCATDPEIDEVVEILGEHGLVLFHCASAYPAKPEQYSLRRLYDVTKYAKYGKVGLGLSDHSLGYLVSVVTSTHVNVIIERHLTLRVDAPDASFSDTPKELAERINLCRQARKMAENTTWTPSTRYKRQMVDGRFVRVVQ